MFAERVRCIFCGAAVMQNVIISFNLFLLCAVYCLGYILRNIIIEILTTNILIFTVKIITFYYYPLMFWAQL